MRILVIGESCMDVYQYGDSTRLCPEAPVPVFNCNGAQRSNIGMAANVYNNIKSLTTGADIDVDINTNPSWEKITKKRFVDFRTNYLVARVDTNDDLYGACEVDKIDFHMYDAVVISDYHKGFLTTQDISDQSATTFLDTKKILGSWAENIDFIKINDVEYSKTEHSVTSKLKSKMIITMGPDGCEYQEKRFPVQKVEIKDAAGAGDTFISALAVEYVKNNDIIKAIKFANECATKVVQVKGVAIA